jgi:hypothetical protein
MLAHLRVVPINDGAGDEYAELDPRAQPSKRNDMSVSMIESIPG